MILIATLIGCVENNGCTKDNECKGNRICSAKGICESQHDTTENSDTFETLPPTLTLSCATAWMTLSPVNSLQMQFLIENKGGPGTFKMEITREACGGPGPYNPLASLGPYDIDADADLEIFEKIQLTQNCTGLLMAQLMVASASGQAYTNVGDPFDVGESGSTYYEDWQDCTK